MTKHSNVIWLRDVPGLGCRKNTVCCATDLSRGPTRFLVLFPGDIMDEANEMPSQLREFSFENMAVSLLDRDRSVGSVVVVKPVEHLDETAWFANFVSVAPGSSDAPYRPDGHATEHLLKLMEIVREKLDMKSLPRLVLAGFSRGGVVINQMITELAQQKLDEIWSRVDEIRWIDTGNSPGIGAFPLDEAGSKRFAELARSQPIRVLIAGSPFQWKNPFRPSILIERRRFVGILRNYLSHPHLTVRYHFADHASNLDAHFGMLLDHLHPENGIDITAGA